MANRLTSKTVALPLRERATRPLNAKERVRGSGRRFLCQGPTRLIRVRSTFKLPSPSRERAQRLPSCPLDELAALVQPRCSWAAALWPAPSSPAPCGPAACSRRRDNSRSGCDAVCSAYSGRLRYRQAHRPPASSLPAPREMLVRMREPVTRRAIVNTTVSLRMDVSSLEFVTFASASMTRDPGTWFRGRAQFRRWLRLVYLLTRWR